MSVAKKDRRSVGLCSLCGEPWPVGKPRRCPDCQLKDTLQTRARRRAKQTASSHAHYRCTLCQSTGHTYTTCKSNSESIQ